MMSQMLGRLIRGNLRPPTRATLLKNLVCGVSSKPRTIAMISIPVRTRAQIADVIKRGLSSASADRFVVEHDAKNHKFVVKLDPDNNAFIEYEPVNNSEVLLYHTEVPKLYGGKGIGQLLAEKAFEHFEKSGQKMVITCTYLQKFDKKRQAPK